MLKLWSSMDVCRMVDEMIVQIKQYWKDPFNPPTVIFPDPMVEKWFKLYWLKTNSVLLNLKFERIDHFLFTTLQNDENARILSDEMLRLAIIKKVSSDGYYKSLGEDIERYLSDTDANGNESINWNRLYDYSKSMSELFLEYERTRLDWDESAKADEVDTNSLWYRSEVKLYNDLFTDGLLELNGIKFSTFNQLFKRSGGKYLDSPNRQPVFIFGFPGLGKAYIDALKKLPESYNVFIYIQSSSEAGFCGFGKHGTAFLKAWKNGSEQLKDDKPRIIDGNLIPKFVAAPSKVREIDKIHNEICMLLKNSDSPMLSDIKVFAPNIKDYIPAICLVFNQSVRQQNGFWEPIPYSISDYSAKTSNTYEAVNILFRMFEKGFFSRADFIKLINNPVVRASRFITEDDVNNWKKWIMETNTYRNRINRDDWEIVKNRLLLSRLTDETINGLSPYEPIGIENSVLFRFMDLIDNLEEWVGLRKTDFNLTVESVKALLINMLSLGKSDDKALKGELGVYRNVMGALSNLLTAFGRQEINYKIIFLMIMDSISGASLSMSNEVKGIEFINIKHGRILPAKYTFFIGMDSNSFPGTDKKNVLDVRNHLDEESIVLRNKNALYCQMQATEKEIHFSYVNKDLKKDADFYRSSVLNDIAKELNRVKDGQENLMEDKIGIDVTWKMVFTNRNKRDNIISSIPIDSIKYESEVPTINNATPPKRVSISQLRRFLEEPLKFQIETAFGYGDEDIEKEDTEFEPLFLDNLTASNLRKRFIREKIFTEDKINEYLKSIGLRYDSDGLYGEMVIKKIKKEIDNLNIGIKELMMVESFADKLSVRVGTLKGTIKHITDGHEWEISNRSSYYNYNYEISKRIVVIDNTGFSSAYATAISLLSRVKDDEEYDLELYYFDINQESVSKLCVFNVIREYANSELDEYYRSKWSDDKYPRRAVSNASRYKDLNSKIILDNIIQYSELEIMEIEKDVISYKMGSSEFSAKSKEFIDLVKKTIQKETGKKNYNGKRCSVGGIQKGFKDLCMCFKIDSIEYGVEALQNTKTLEYDFDLNSDEMKEKNNEHNQYCISGIIPFYSFDEPSRHILIVDMKKKSEVKDFLNGYVSSLAILSTLSDDFEFTLSLCLISPDDGGVTVKPICFTAEKAKQILSNIYSDAFITKRQKFLPINSIDNSEITYEDVIQDAENLSGSWSHFRKSRIIEIPDGLGYNHSNFESQWKEEVAAQSKLIESLLDREE